MTRTFCVFGFPGTYTHMAFHLWIFQKCTRRGWPFTFRCTSFHFHQISGSAISHHRGPISPHEPQQTWGVRGTSGHPKQTESAEVDPRPKSWWVTELERLWGGFGSPIRNGAFYFLCLGQLECLEFLYWSGWDFEFLDFLDFPILS